LVIQTVLVGVLVGLLVVFTRREHGLHMQVGKRLAFVAFIGVTVYGVLRPDDLTWVANRVGVGRGADLLLYGLLVAVIFLVVNTGLRFRSVDRQLTELVRALALQNAELRDPVPADPDTHP
jgi:small membrane protein